MEEDVSRKDTVTTSANADTASRATTVKRKVDVSPTLA